MATKKAKKTVKKPLPPVVKEMGSLGIELNGQVNLVEYAKDGSIISKSLIDGNLVMRVIAQVFADSIEKWGEEQDKKNPL